MLGLLVCLKKVSHLLLMMANMWGEWCSLVEKWQKKIGTMGKAETKTE